MNTRHSLKLIPAIAMLLVSAFLATTATYAWFSMNNIVVATDMEVTVSSASALLISKTPSTGYKGTVSLVAPGSMADEILPTVYDSSMNFFKLTDEAMASVNENGVMGAPHATDNIEDNDTYDATTVDYFADTVYLLYTGDSATATADLTVTCTYTTSGVTTDPIRNAFHVVFVVDGNLVADIDMGTSNATAVYFATLTTDTEATVQIYGYLSGNDSDCKNSSITANADLSLDIEFNIV